MIKECPLLRLPCDLCWRELPTLSFPVIVTSAPLSATAELRSGAPRISSSYLMSLSVNWHWDTVLTFNPLNSELNPICYLLALLGAHHFLHVSRIRVKLLTFRRLMLYIYMERPFLMFLDHTQRRSTVGRTPLDE